MKIHSASRITHPHDAVFLAYRDRLSEVATYIPDIRQIIVHARREEDDRVVLHNEWIADRDIPAVVASYVKPEHLRWDDHATWHTEGTYCAWRLEPRAFTGAVNASGRTTITAISPTVTEVVLSGDLAIDLTKVRGVPRLLAGRLTPTVERFIVSLISPNLERVNGAIQQYLDAGAR